MRIISGKYRRRNLATTPGITTRPITSRVKECLFENIEKRIIGKRVADIFAGTGTIGLEALSRGASCVTFIEKDRKALELLHENIAMLACEEQSLVWPADILRCSFKPKGDRADIFSPLDTLFFDPPYKMVKDIQPGKKLWLSLKRMARDEVSAPDASLIFRAPEHVDFELPEEWKIEWTLEMSHMVIHVCDKKMAKQS